jgi:L-cysteine S-thiosulfotransferase
MKKIVQTLAPVALALSAVFLAGCAAVPSSADLDKLTADIIKASFRDEALVKTDRLVQDDTNRECSAADVAGKPIDEAKGKAIEAANMKAIKWPSDGKFIGDWREGEKIAQSGRGLTWSDDAAQANGGNCYNCHQIDKKEISYGTIGPSLYNYGKIRGVKDPASADSKGVVEYTWGKIWNSKAYNACSNMPRAGHSGILSEAQVRHVVGLLLDPKSPVNE